MQCLKKEVEKKVPDMANLALLMELTFRTRKLGAVTPLPYYWSKDFLVIY
jgi:hypothetical protein